MLGALPPQEAEAIERQVETDPALARRVGALEETFAALTLDLPLAPAPSPALKARLLKSAQAQPHLPFVDRLARLFDVASAQAASFLDLLGRWDQWEELVPGGLFVDVDGGPALAGVRPGLVYVEPGVHFPVHRHIGEETSLYIQGEARFDDGMVARAGELRSMPDGSTHGFTVTSEVPLIFAVVVGGVEMEDPES